MKRIIEDMIEQAVLEESYELINYVRRLIERFSNTVNCPSNWRSIGEELANEYTEDTWIYEELELWNYIEEME